MRILAGLLDKNENRKIKGTNNNYYIDNKEFNNNNNDDNDNNNNTQQTSHCCRRDAEQASTAIRNNLDQLRQHFDKK